MDRLLTAFSASEATVENRETFAVIKVIALELLPALVEVLVELLFELLGIEDVEVTDNALMAVACTLISKKDSGGGGRGGMSPDVDPQTAERPASRHVRRTACLAICCCI